MTDHENKMNKQPVDMGELKEQLRRELLQELKDERSRELEERSAQRKKEAEERQKYVDLMKESSEPWVDIVGWTDTKQGIKVELDWNDAFVLHLKDNGITGADDDQIVQQWITLLLRDMADDMSDDGGSSQYA